MSRPFALTRGAASAPDAAAPDAADAQVLSPALPEPLQCDTTLRYVRVTEVRSNGQVAFDFAIGWPELSVELMLPRAAFDRFCAENQVIRLDLDSAETTASTPGLQRRMPHPDDPEETDE